MSNVAGGALDTANGFFDQIDQGWRSTKDNLEKAEYPEWLQKLLAATVDDLQTVDGVGETRARSVRESLSRLADASIMDRFS